MKNRIFLIIGIVILILIVAFAISHSSNKGLSNQTASTTPSRTVLNFYECVAVGYPTTSSYPRQCTAQNGVIFIEDLLPSGTSSEPESVDSSATGYKDLIKITDPKPGSVVKTPLHIEGEARGDWYFEATFSVKVLDSNKDVIGNGIAHAKSDWMTHDYVPFSADITFKNNSPLLYGTLVLEKDNPSGLEERGDSWNIPIKFEK